MPILLVDDDAPVRLRDDAAERLAARDEQLRNADGTPYHTGIISACGFGTTQWWRLRNGQQMPGTKTLRSLLHLAMRTGLTRQEAYDLLFTTEPRDNAEAAA